MVYIQLRITLDPSGNRTRTNVFQLLTKFIRTWIHDKLEKSDTEFSSGYEELNKYGEPCAPHYHLNLSGTCSELTNPLRSAKNWLIREAGLAEFTLRGSRAWSCTMVEEPKDYLRWIRYPLKEQPLGSLSHHPQSVLTEHGGFLDLTRDAQVERKRSIEINLIKRQKLADKTTLKDKLFEHLDKHFIENLQLDGHELSEYHQLIWIAILLWYKEQGRAINFQTINGYTTLYELHIGTLTPSQAYMRSHNNN